MPINSKVRGHKKMAKIKGLRSPKNAKRVRSAVTKIKKSQIHFHKNAKE